MKKILVILLMVACVNAQSLIYERTETGFNTGCSYYTIHGFQENYYLSQSEFRVSYTDIVKGDLKNIHVEILEMKPYTDYETSYDNYCEMINESNGSVVKRCFEANLQYTEITKYKPVWSKFEGIQMKRGDVQHIRICGSFERENLNTVGKNRTQDFKVEIDHIPHFLNTDYPEYAWWNNSYHFAYQQNLTYTGVYATYENYPITKSVCGYLGKHESLAVVYNDSFGVWQEQPFEWFHERRGANGLRSVKNCTIRFRVNLTNGVSNFDYWIYVSNTSGLPQRNVSLFAFFDGYENANFTGYINESHLIINTSEVYAGNYSAELNSSLPTGIKIDIGTPLDSSDMYAAGCFWQDNFNEAGVHLGMGDTGHTSSFFIGTKKDDATIAHYDAGWHFGIDDISNNRWFCIHWKHMDTTAGDGISNYSLNLTHQKANIGTYGVMTDLEYFCMENGVVYGSKALVDEIYISDGYDFNLYPHKVITNDLGVVTTVTTTTTTTLEEEVNKTDCHVTNKGYKEVCFYDANNTEVCRLHNQVYYYICGHDYDMELNEIRVKKTILSIFNFVEGNIWEIGYNMVIFIIIISLTYFILLREIK